MVLLRSRHINDRTNVNDQIQALNITNSDEHARIKNRVVWAGTILRQGDTVIVRPPLCN